MVYQSQEIEILSEKKVFGRALAEIRILSTGEIKTVPLSEIQQTKQTNSIYDWAFKLTAGKIKAEMAKQSLLAPIESNIIPLPHQILALEKVLSGPYLRYLIADEVGMGKTIETGLVLKELKLRGIVKRALVIVPKSAMGQWQNEMKKHFNESFHIYDTDYINTLSRTFARLESDNDINLFAQHNQIIVSMDALKPIETRQGWSRQKVEEYNRFRIQNVVEADFDLIVIDECHKVGGSTSQVGRYQMADILCNAIPNVLLLSATPHRGKSDHFRRILQLLDADAFTGEGAPSIKELEPYVVRTEKRQAIDYNGKPLFNKRQTRKLDVPYHPTKHKKQQALYEAITQYVIKGFNMSQQTKNTSYGFVMLLFQRLMSSSTQAILDAMQKRAARLSSARSEVNKETIINDWDQYTYDSHTDSDFEQNLIMMVEETKANYDTELSLLQGLIRDAKECIQSETDAKVEILLEKFSELKRQEQNLDLKFLVFTEFTGTQLMLKQFLEQKGGYSCDMINGSMDFDQRVDALKKFKDSTQILICTDAAGESLNMQFAHIVINYDIPWNPMVLEQRIGRVDRIGQTHEVLALNMLLQNSVDKRVYEVVEIKLNQIMTDLGIDKTSDVLDSTLERDKINQLYLASLLDPSRFERESEHWLDEIKQKLLDYKSTEGVLPTLTKMEITTEKVEPIKHSPLPKWLEQLTTFYLIAKQIPFTLQLDGLKVQLPGKAENLYTFNLKDSINNPIPEPLSLQHTFIQTVLQQATAYTHTQPIPQIRFKQGQTTKGTFTLWELKVQNQFETQYWYQPLFISHEGDYFAAYANTIWDKFVMDPDQLELLSTKIPKSIDLIQKWEEKAQEILLSKYQSMETTMLERMNKTKSNKEKAFLFQEKQLNRIGIENIRTARLNRLQKEKEDWTQNFSNASQIIPTLTCLTIVQCTNETVD